MQCTYKQASINIIYYFYKQSLDEFEMQIQQYFSKCESYEREREREREREGDQRRERPAEGEVAKRELDVRYAYPLL